MRTWKPAAGRSRREVLGSALALSGGLVITTSPLARDITARGSASAASAAASAEQASTLAEQYTWYNVQIAGGGFVPGIVFNRSEPNLIYARTDIGGAYRWDESAQEWTPLLDHVGWDDWGHSGVASLATDPVDPDNVYAAVGTYTNSWDPDNGAILRSSDRGESWQTTELPFKLGGNMPGRGMGERLVIDPNDNRVLYFGAPSGQGLWRSTDSGVTWSEVTSFPNPGDYVIDASDTSGYNSDIIGVVWIVFDPATGSSGSRTQTIYAGVCDSGECVYRSTDAGQTWAAVSAHPTGFLPHQGVLDEQNGYLYIATSDDPGPYSGSDGEVWRLDTATGTWTDISPVASGSDRYFGFSGLTVDRQHPGTLMCTAYSAWWPDTQFFRSTDGGDTWTQLWTWASYPNRDKRYQMDISEVPWLDWGSSGTAPEDQPKVGWMTESLAIDPFDSDRMMYGTGATIYGTTELTNWDSDQTFTISPMVTGLEETSVKDLAAPPGDGTQLLSALGDIGGFRHPDITQVPGTMVPLGTATSVDFAEQAVNNVVIVGDRGDDDTPPVYFSTDSGSNWFAGTDPATDASGGTVAAAADGSSYVWAPSNTGVYVTTNYGSSWTACSGIPQGATVRADREDPDLCYGFSGGTFYRSTDGGQAFGTSSASGLPSDGGTFTAVAGHSGHVWLAGGSGLWRSTDGGQSFSQVSGIEADTIGVGKAASGASYPALYSSGVVSGVRGIYRSTDTGQTWERINDDEHQYAWTGAAITGDPDVYGRVYVSTNGRGIIVGDIADGTSDGGGGDGDDGGDDGDGDGDGDSGGGTGTVAVSYQVASEWTGGFQGEVTLTNNGSSTVNDWSVSWTFPSGQQITQLWNGSYTQSGSQVTVTPASWNSTISAGSSVSFGFTASWSGSNTNPTSFTVTTS